MPELPEVETIANGVHDRVAGRRILAVWTSGKPQTFKSSEAEIAAALTGARIAQVRRVGKTIVMTVERPRKAVESKQSSSAKRAQQLAQSEFLIHLGMTGRLVVSQPEVSIPIHTHAILTLDDGREVRFIDPRRFGRLSLHSPLPLGSGAPGFGSRKWNSVRKDVESATDPRQPSTSYAGPGREPLTISVQDFIALFRARRTPIKAALLNQSLLHGVGNIYADESLFRAGIRPHRQAGRLTHAQLIRLRTGLVEVLSHAIELGGSSVSDYVDADGVRGFFQLEHKVYMRTGLPCLICTTPIKKITIAGRSTHFCPNCQR